MSLNYCSALLCESCWCPPTPGDTLIPFQSCQVTATHLKTWCPQISFTDTKELCWLDLKLEDQDSYHMTTRAICSTAAWWRHQMKTFSAFLALCVGNSLVTDEFPSQRPVTRSFDVFFDLCLKKNGWVNNREAGDLRRHCTHYDIIVMSTFTLAITSNHQFSLALGTAHGASILAFNTLRNLAGLWKQSHTSQINF